MWKFDAESEEEGFKKIMEKEIRQILKNQISLMESNNSTFFETSIKETEELISQKSAEEDCCDMGEDVESEESA